MGLLWKLALFTNRTLSAGEKSSFTAKVIYQGWRRIIGCGAFFPGMTTTLMWQKATVTTRCCLQVSYYLCPFTTQYSSRLVINFGLEPCVWVWEGFRVPFSLYIESVGNQMAADCHATHFRQRLIFMSDNQVVRLNWNTYFMVRIIVSFYIIFDRSYSPGISS